MDLEVVEEKSWRRSGEEIGEWKLFFLPLWSPPITMGVLTTA
jgi:hypothetical protein